MIGNVYINFMKSHITSCVIYVLFFTFRKFNIIQIEFKPCFQMCIKIDIFEGGQFN